jgi:dTDP-4-amino-4,6-dideoxygalactose transaminase
VRYYHDEVGYNSRLDEVQAAVLNVKFKRIDSYNEGRRRSAALYARQLSFPGITPPVELRDCKHVFHQYTIRIKDRDAVKKRLDEARMSSMIYYPVPCHLQAAYRDLGMQPGSLPAAERSAQEVLSLPMYPELTEEQVRTVADAVKKAM